MCRKFSLLKDTEEAVCPIFSGFISALQLMSPAYKEESVSGSKVICDVPLNMSGNLWSHVGAGEEPLGCFHLADLAVLLVVNVNLGVFKSSWHHLVGQHGCLRSGMY